MNSYLTQIEAQIRQNLRAYNEETARAVEAEMKRLCPVDTGRLRESITHESDDEGFLVGPTEPYGIHVELGTRNQRPQPFIVPAFQKSKSRLGGS